MKSRIEEAVKKRKMAIIVHKQLLVHIVIMQVVVKKKCLIYANHLEAEWER